MNASAVTFVLLSETAHILAAGGTLEDVRELVGQGSSLRSAALLRRAGASQAQMLECAQRGFDLDAAADLMGEVASFDVALDALGSSAAPDRGPVGPREPVRLPARVRPARRSGFDSLPVRSGSP